MLAEVLYVTIAAAHLAWSNALVTDTRLCCIAAPSFEM